jgi:sugar/nucleoside kinase (ribokinase family)
MSSPAFDVAAIGNALVDVIAHATDGFLANHKIAKGAMTLIDAPRAEELYGAIGPAIEMSGGSAGNTIAGVASLGGKAAYMGKVKADQLGAIFRHDLRAQGVHFATPDSKATTTPTGRSLILVTPDAERSMNTFLGAAVEFSPADVDAETLRQSSVTYLEGYLFDPPEAQKAFYHAAKIVRESGRQLALTLSDTFCVERHHAAFRDLVTEHVDILFANENELKALYRTDNLQEAIAAVRAHCPIAVTTCSERGAIIVSGKETAEVPAVSVAKVVDTTGAGDLYAAGFLYGLTHGKSLSDSGHIGAIAAAEVISHVGPRPQVKLSSLLSA